MSKLKFEIQLAWRFLRQGSAFLPLSTWVAICKLVIGVACLTAAMCVVSGFEKTVKTAVTGVFGHIMMIVRTESGLKTEGIIEKIKKVAPEIKAMTPFLTVEAIIAHQGKLSGIRVEGVNPNDVTNVLDIQQRVIKGEWKFPNANDVLLGKSLAKKLNLQIGQIFKVALPYSIPDSPQKILTRIQEFHVVGIVDLGKFEYDDRYIIAKLETVQEWANVKTGVTGFRLKLHNENDSHEVAARISKELSPSVWLQDWSEVNKNLFEAIKIERVVIFFVILVMVIASCFNVASQLFVNIFQRTREASLLAAIGMTGKRISRIFTIQGLIIGVLGIVGGIFLGLSFAFIFEWMQGRVLDVPADVYKIGHIGIEIRFFDIFGICLASFFITWIATIWPAKRAAKIQPITGLRYE